MIIKKIEHAIKELNSKLFYKIERYGVNETARKAGVNKGYISRIYNGKQKISVEKMIELYKKL